MRARLLPLFAFLLLSAGSPAWGHAFLDHANPRVGSSIRVAPREVTLSFTQGLEAAFSTVSVTGPAGQKADSGRPRISGSTMSVGIRSAGPGTYHVQWRVLSVDTHTTEGNFSFSVGQ